MTQKELTKLIENTLRMLYGHCSHWSDAPRYAEDCYTCKAEKIVEVMEKMGVVTWDLPSASR